MHHRVGDVEHERLLRIAQLLEVVDRLVGIERPKGKNFVSSRKIEKNAELHRRVRTQNAELSLMDGEKCVTEVNEDK